jgi:hypothetical protein
LLVFSDISNGKLYLVSHERIGFVLWPTKFTIAYEVGGPAIPVRAAFPTPYSLLTTHYSPGQHIAMSLRSRPPSAPAERDFLVSLVNLRLLLATVALA